LGNNRPVKKKDWIKFLKAHGFEKQRNNRHEIWKKKDVRPFTFRAPYKDIPALHLKTCLSNINKDLHYLYNWIENN